jgi:hypothetical protein
MDMSEIAQRYDAAPTVDITRPSLELVRDALAQPTEAPARAAARPWRYAAIGGATGFVAMTLAITIIGTLSGIGLGGAFGLGIFVGGFGGIGFGFMMGGMTGLASEFTAHPKTAIPHHERKDQ